jgi:NADPH:quinone reductase
MIALQHARFGEPSEVIEAIEIPEPQPRLHEARLRLVLSPIHNHDLATIRGVYGYKPALPAIGGSEFLGVRDGKRFVGAARGAWADEVVVPESGLVPVPDAIGDEIACQLIAMPLSAVVLVDELHLQPGMWIAQNAAGGAVGRIVMQLAQRASANVVNFVRRDDAADELRQYGARHVVVTANPDWHEEARALTDGAGFARIVDSVAGAGSLDLLRLLAPGGELIVFGGLSGAAVKLDPSLMIALEAVVRGFWMTSWMQRASEEQRSAAMRRVFELALAGELPLPVAGVYPLRDAARALAAAQTPGRAGKVVFRP